MLRYVPMYIESIPNRNSPPAILLRESWRDGGRIRKRTLVNLSKWPPHLVDGLRILLRGGTAVPRGEAVREENGFDITRSRPFGHVVAVLGVLRDLGLDRLIAARSSRLRELAVAMIVARIVAPRSKLATARGLSGDTLSDGLGEALALGEVDEDELYEAMDWLLQRQGRIERALAERHLEDGALVLYDVTSTWLEGRCCPLARHGYSRDGKRGKLQIVFGLLCNAQGCPVAVEVFEGNTADPATLGTQIDKVRRRFRLSRVVLVGDRGMLTEARIREEVKPAGLEWITALRAPAIRELASSGTLQPSLFDERDLAEIHHPDFPGERLIACRNPLLAVERARKREALLRATENDLDEVRKATRRDKRRLAGKDKIGLRVGKVIGRHKVAKHFDLEIADDGFAWRRNAGRIAEETALDGLYVVRTSLPERELGAEDTVRAYKGLSRIERAFRSVKTVDLKVRPIHHYRPERVRAHVLLCMLAYHVEWHMRQKLAPILFDEDDPAGADAARASIVAPAEPSPSARRKAASKRTPEGVPVHSFRTILDDLATIARNRVQPKLTGAPPFDLTTKPTKLQRQALDLLGVSL